MPLSTYERARLRLQAFEMLDGWGRTDDKGVFRKFNQLERREKAISMVAWALSETPNLCCSFCAKASADVGKLIAGPEGVMICDECVGLCVEIVEGKNPDAIEKARLDKTAPPAAGEPKS